MQEYPSVQAPYVHPHNMPKYYALQLRAVEYAKAHGRGLNWIVAQDYPLAAEDQHLTQDQLAARKQVWLGWHDQKTGGIMGLLPLVLGLPVRVTQTVDRDRHIFKNSRGASVGWVLHAEERSTFDGSSYERVLSHQPLCIYVKVNNAKWTIDDRLGQGVFPLRPRRVVWSRDKAENASVSRRGFTMVADFSGTAHSYQGATLAAAIADCLEYFAKPRLVDMLTSYVTMSRVRLADTLLLIQTYAPSMFQRGPPPGPHVLMEFLRGHLNEGDL